MMMNKLAYLCSSTSWGGLEMNQLKNAVWMKERGHEVVILCKKDSPILQNARDENIPVLLIDGHKKYYDFKAGKALAKLIDENGITHLLVRDTRDMSVSVIAKRNSKYEIHLSYFMEMQLGVKKKNIFHTIRFSYFDLWSCPLEWLKVQVETMTNYKKKGIRVIPSGLDLRKFENELTKDEARTILELPSNKIIFGLIGRFDPHKGQLLLLEALSKIDDPNVCICFLGEATKEANDDYMNNLQAMITENKLEERVFIRPFRKDISVFFNAINAFVMASRAETFGMVTIEAMACGTAILASNAGGSPEILNMGKLGLLFEPMDAESLARKMDYFLNNQDEFTSEELKIEARKYDFNKVCERVEEELHLK
jgi:glycosyltransferase involved in cell wall biosynthesis